MIYLIDDKSIRQEKDFGWTEEKFAQFDQHLKPLYNISDVVSIGEDLYKDGNVILYHESFLDFTFDRERAVEQRKKLIKKAEEIKDLHVAFFSGSQSSRSLQKNLAELHVSILYQNLEVFIHQYSNQVLDLKYLLFGGNPKIEEELGELLNQANRVIETEAADISGRTLFIRPNVKYIQNAIKGAVEGIVFNDVSDQKLSEKIDQWLSDTDYENIFIPLCFGQTLSDYNGLRLATHIRCSISPNQLKRLFIYGFIGIEYLLENEYFNVLKTKNIQLVEYSKKEFEAATKEEFTFLQQNDLSQEIGKLKLDPPLNYMDSHSIANEWAIHQWAKTLGCEETEKLGKIFRNVESNLYFKYLRTVYPISRLARVSSEKLKINFQGNPKVLLIDDEADKGWYEIFAYLLGDLNKIHFDYLAEDFRTLSKEGIIDRSLKKMKGKDNDIEIDVVILDFRLQSDDFQGSNLKENSSIQLLEKIKDFNPGVQVIIFSATNKVWNLQALQKAGADGFIIKDGSENIHQTIESFTHQMSLSLKKASWLKDIYKSFDRIKSNAASLSDPFKASLENNLLISFELLSKSFQTQKYINYAYLQLFLIVEEYIKEDSIFEHGDNSYVIAPSQRYLVLSKKEPEKKDSAYKSALTWTSGHFKVGESEYKRRIDTNFVISSILLFRNGLPTSGSQNWSKIYGVRNGKAAHPEKGLVQLAEVNVLASFLEFLLDESQINPVETTKALKEPSMDEKLEILKKKFGS
jgi:CheY-like chemotaxis protein